MPHVDLRAPLSGCSHEKIGDRAGVRKCQRAVRRAAIESERQNPSFSCWMEATIVY